jgi:hypothetical protein
MWSFKLADAFSWLLTSLGGALLVAAVLFVPSSAALADGHGGSTCNDVNCDNGCTNQMYPNCAAPNVCKKDPTKCGDPFCLCSPTTSCHCTLQSP